jgi:DNA-binding transcriptional ArsR family regulator
MAYEMLSAWSALADPTRREVLRRVAASPAPVRAIAAGLPVSRPAVSQHLAVLKAAGLVTDERRGQARIYRLRAEGLGEIRRWLDALWEEALVNFKEEAERGDDDNGGGVGADRQDDRGGADGG